MQAHLCANSIPASRSHRIAALGLVVLLVFGVWGFLLPHLASHPTMQQKIQLLQQQGIDPNAFFYTDHPQAFVKD